MTSLQYYRIKRIVDMVREGSEEGYLPNRGDFRREMEVSTRTLARDLDFLRDEERAPIEYDATRHGYRLTDVKGSAFCVRQARPHPLRLWRAALGTNATDNRRVTSDPSYWLSSPSALPDSRRSHRCGSHVAPPSW